MESPADPSSLARPEDSLLRYDSPLLITAEETLSKDPLQSHKKAQLPPIDSYKSSLEEILSSIFPNLELEEEVGKRLIYKISQDQASRTDLEELEKLLQLRLAERQARSQLFLTVFIAFFVEITRKNGICPVREDLHNQMFDEIIRQCTINCPERGKFLNFLGKI